MNSLRTRIINRIARNTITQLQGLATATSVNPAVPNPETEIQIPIKKERGPTDILEALESTITHDPTAADYKYIDDPYLIPTSSSKKRQFSLSREAGMKAAIWVLDQHADLLKSNLSEPLIQAFLPPEKYEKKEQVSEELLNELIKQGRVADVLHVYHLLEENVGKETKQAILELLCFFNSSTDSIPENFLEERFFSIKTEINKNMWKDDPNIEKLFGELKNDKATAANAYNALLCGTAKYLRVDRAMNLYNECIVNNIPIFLSTYNYLIRIAYLLKDNQAECQTKIQEFLKNMAESGIKPNIQTLNAVLKCTSTFKIQGSAKEFALSLLTEFKSIGIKPCLASYYYLLLVFCRETGPTSYILREILDELEKEEELKMQDPNDIFFFQHAMEVATKHMHDIKTGNRLHNLLLTKNNYKLIGENLKENVYYRNYLYLLLTSETLEDFMKIYDKLVPRIYVPETELMKNILDMLEFNDKELVTQLLPKFCSQVVQFNMMDRYVIIGRLFSLMCKHCIPPEGSPLHEEYAKVAWNIFTYIEDMNQRRLQPILFSSNVYGNMSSLLLRANEFDKMTKVFDHVLQNEDKLFNVMSSDKIMEIYKAFVDRGHVPGALSALKYSLQVENVDVHQMAEQLQKTVPLSASQEEELKKILKTPRLTNTRENKRARNHQRMMREE